MENKINLDIPQFNPARFFKKFLDKFNSFTCIISGSRMSGKSNMLKFFLTKKAGGLLMEKFNMIVVFSKTFANGHYQRFLKTKLMFDEFNPGIIDFLKKTYEENKKEGKKFKFLVIFDDMVTDMKYQKSIDDFFFNSRHYGGSCFFLTQKTSMASQNWKNNTTLFIILNSGSFKEERYLAEDVIASAIYKMFPVGIKTSTVQSYAIRLQADLLTDYNSIIITPFCKRKIKQFRPPLIKD